MVNQDPASGTCNNGPCILSKNPTRSRQVQVHQARYDRYDDEDDYSYEDSLSPRPRPPLPPSRYDVIYLPREQVQERNMKAPCTSTCNTQNSRTSNVHPKWDVNQFSDVRNPVLMSAASARYQEIGKTDAAQNPQITKNRTTERPCNTCTNSTANNGWEQQHVNAVPAGQTPYGNETCFNQQTAAVLNSFGRRTGIFPGVCGGSPQKCGICASKLQKAFDDVPPTSHGFQRRDSPRTSLSQNLIEDTSSGWRPHSNRGSTCNSAPSSPTRSVGNPASNFNMTDVMRRQNEHERYLAELPSISNVRAENASNVPRPHFAAGGPKSPVVETIQTRCRSQNCLPDDEPTKREHSDIAGAAVRPLNKVQSSVYADSDPLSKCLQEPKAMPIHLMNLFNNRNQSASNKSEAPQSSSTCKAPCSQPPNQLLAEVNIEERKQQQEQARCKRVLYKLQHENLVKDSYCPGIIQETINGCENFNVIAFDLVFGNKIPEKFPQTEPMTLLEAFALRIDNERDELNYKSKPNKVEIVEEKHDEIFQHNANKEPLANPFVQTTNKAYQQQHQKKQPKQKFESDIDAHFAKQNRTDLNEAISNLLKAEKILEQEDPTKSTTPNFTLKIDKIDSMLPGGKPIRILAFNGITTPKFSENEE